MCVGIAIVVFDTYLLYDTQTMVSGSKYEWKHDDYITGSYMVYFDILMIIFKLFRALSRELFSRR